MKTIYLKIIKWILFISASIITGKLLANLFDSSNSFFLITPLIPYLAAFLIFWIAWAALSIHLHRRKYQEPEKKGPHEILFDTLYALLHLIILLFIIFIFQRHVTSDTGFGTPVKFTPDMWHPVGYKSADFNGAIAYDPNYDPDKDELLQFMNSIQDKIYNSETHNYKEGGSFALDTGKEDLEWQTDAKQPKQTISGRIFGIKGLDNAERQRVQNFFKDSGFIANQLNTTTDAKAYSNGKFACLYQENVPFLDFQIKCAMLN